ncbi:Transposase Tc1-like [Trinorchestia longiramus]|nr:Transposase Tc1-like [Trinorchestia longiramus]
MSNKKSQFSSYSDLSSPVRVEIGDGRALKGVGVGDVRLKITLPNMQVLLSRDVVFNESQFMSFEKEPSKEIECVPWSFLQEEKHEDSEGELELLRSTRNRAAPDRFGEWVCFAQDKFDVPRAISRKSQLWKRCVPHLFGDPLNNFLHPLHHVRSADARPKFCLPNLTSQRGRLNTTLSKPRTGRPRKINDRAARTLVRTVVQRPQTTREELKDNLKASGIEASKHTINRALRCEDLCSCTPHRTPLL